MIFVEYPKCTTCRKAKKFLDEHKLVYEDRNIKEENPTVAELKQWIPESGKDSKKFFNTSGQIYRAQGLKDKVPTMSEEERLELLATDGMLVKRPILIVNDQVLVGFKQAEWEALLLKK